METIFYKLIDLTYSLITLQTRTALLYDAVQMFSEAMYASSQRQGKVTPRRLDCDRENRWEAGAKIVKLMKMVSGSGGRDHEKGKENVTSKTELLEVYLY